MKRLMMLMMAGMMAIALVACDNGDGDPTTDPIIDPPSTGTTAPTDPTQPAPTDPTPTNPAPTDPDEDFERVEELAPIDQLEMLFAESDPVQHRLHIVSGLPSGCAAFERVDVEQDGTTFNVEVVNTMPAPDEDVACTMVYGLHESTVELGSDLEVGTEYTVNVNDQTITFVAQ